MKINEAKEIAQNICSQLAPYCHRIEIAGSIRRLKPEVKDIEIVCIPVTERVKTGLFDMDESYATEVNPEFIRIVNSWEKIKGEPTGKYTQRKLPEGINLDLFIANKYNWGLIYAIRTGSAEYSHKVLAAGWVKRGWKSIDGMLCQYGEGGIWTPIKTPEEKDLFDLIGVKMVSPEKREFK